MIIFFRKRYIAYIITIVVVLVSTIHLFMTYTPFDYQQDIIDLFIEEYRPEDDNYNTTITITEEYIYEQDEIESQESTQLASTPQEDSISYEITNIQERFFENRPGDFRYEALVQVTNTGTVPIIFGTSRFDLIDENDGILTANNTFTVRTRVLHPGERGYLWANERVTGATSSTEARLIPRWDIDRSIHYRADLEISNVAVRDHPNRFIDSLIVLGNVTNNTNAEIDRVDITIILYTHDKTPIGIWHTTVRNLPAGESFGFETSSSNTTFTDLTSDIVGDFTTFASDFWQRNR